MAALKPILNKSYIYASYALAASIPFTENISTIVIALWVFFGLFHLQKPHNILRDKVLRQQLILPLYFCLTVIALIYTRDMNEGMAQLERKVSFVLIPLMVIFSSAVIRPHINQILRAFVVGVIGASVICVIMAFFNSISVGDEGIVFNAAVVLKDKSFWESNSFGGNYFFHEQLSIFSHPSYFAIYICFSLFLLGRELLTEQKTVRGSMLRIALLLYLVIFLFFLSARISFIYLGFSLFLLMVIYFKRLASWTKVALVFVVLVFALAILKFNYRIINVFSQDFKNTSLLELSQKSNSFKRVVVWKLVHQNEEGIRIVGTGPGDVHNELNVLYEEAQLEEELSGINAHNQFLESYLGLGFFGLMLLLAIFIPVFGWKLGFLHVHIQLLILTAIFFMLESALERNAFIVFISFFHPLTVHYQNSHIIKRKN